MWYNVILPNDQFDKNLKVLKAKLAKIKLLKTKMTIHKT